MGVSEWKKEEGIDLARFKLIQIATQARMNMKPDFTLDYGLEWKLCC